MSKAYALSITGTEIIKAFGLQGSSEVAPNFNIQPTSIAPVIIQGAEKGLSQFYWGATPGFSKKRTLAEKLYHVPANAISESSPTFRAMDQRRCLIVADGFLHLEGYFKKGPGPLLPFPEGASAICHGWFMGRIRRWRSGSCSYV